MSAIFHTPTDFQESRFNMADSAISWRPEGRSPINLVLDRTACPWGLSVQEMRLVGACMTYLKQRGCGVFISVEGYGLPEADRRQLFSDVKNRLALYQHRAGMRRVLYVEILESKPELHSHIVAIMPSAERGEWLIEQLQNSRYGNRIVSEPVWFWDGLHKYLLGEATSQAHYAANRSFARVPGSHPLGQLGGDRVRLSRDLADYLERTGRTEKRRRTYRKRVPKVRRPRLELIAGPLQLAFDGLRPVARLHDFGGGLMPPAVALEIRHHCKRLGLPITDLAASAMISGPTLFNALAGLYPLSAWAVQRIREVLLDSRQQLPLAA